MIVLNLKIFQPGEDVLHFVDPAFRQQDHEFIATQADREIGSADGALQAFGKSFQQEITRGVTQAIVDGLQVIEIKQEKRQRAAMTHGPAHFLCQTLLARAAIIETCELVQGSQFVNLGGQILHLV